MSDDKPHKPEEDPAGDRQSPGSGDLKKDSGTNWIEKLAQKSAGLPASEGKGGEGSGKPAAGDTGANQLWRFAGLGIQMAATVGIFAFIGHEIDQWRGWKSNQALLTLVLISLIGSLYLLIKEAIKANK